jgi:hypothetical protein
MAEAYREVSAHLLGMTTTYPHLNPDEPWVTIIDAADGGLSVKMVGIDRDVPAHLLDSGQMGNLQDYLYDLFAQPYSVEIIDADGTVYLAAGAADVAIDLGDAALLRAGRLIADSERVGDRHRVDYLARVEVFRPQGGTAHGGRGVNNHGVPKRQLYCLSQPGGIEHISRHRGERWPGGETGVCLGGIGRRHVHLPHGVDIELL